MKPFRILAAMAAALACAAPAQSPTFNSVRAVTFEYESYNRVHTPRNNPPIPGAFLQRAKGAGYTHVIAAFGQSSPTLRADVAAVAGQLNSFGLRIIPYIPVASKWSIDWKWRFTNVDMNVYEADVGGGQKYPFGCPSIASFAGYDVAMETAFQTVIDEIKQGFADACARNASGSCTGLGYHNLEFVYLGHDEPTHNGALLAGLGDPAKRTDAATFSAADRKFIEDNKNKFGSNPPDIDKVFRYMFGRELVRRIEQVQVAVGGRSYASTKVLISGDLWDPEANGGVSMLTHRDNATRKITLSPSLDPNTGMAALPGLTADQAQLVRTQTVIAPWSYYKYWPKHPDEANGGVYEAGRVLEYFARSGMTFMYWGNAGDGNVGFDLPADPTTDPLWNFNVIARLNKIREYASGGRKFAASNLGYIAGIFGCVDYDAEAHFTCYKTMEYMKRLTTRTGFQH